jgi:hypothetical protein
MSAPGVPNRIAGGDEVRAAIAELEDIMDKLEQTLAQETAHVRAGRLRDAGALGQAKLEFARLYTAESERIKAAKDTIARSMPDTFDRLRKRHNAFHDLLRTNMTVLATAHAVSEGIIRGVSGELARKQAPSTYGANGRAVTPATKTSQPLALSLSL